MKLTRNKFLVLKRYYLTGWGDPARPVHVSILASLGCELPPGYEARLLWNDAGHMYDLLADRSRFSEFFIVSSKAERQIGLDFCDLLWGTNILVLMACLEEAAGGCKIGTMSESPQKYMS